jgi:CRISPR-associated protein Cas2
MALDAARIWLIAYDVRSPRRLGRLHRFLSAQATMVQYSVYLFEGSLGQLKVLLREIEPFIEASEDDVRAYPVPAKPQLDILGRGSMGEDICLLSGAAGLLAFLAAPRAAASAEPA